MRNIEHIRHIPIHFLLCTERTGSSLMALMLNLNKHIICPSEEPFALYFYPKYGNIKVWNAKVIDEFIEEFWLMADKNLVLYFSSKEVLRNTLLHYQTQLDYMSVVKLCYLHFYDSKPKDKIEVIVDKQIKYFFHLPQLLQLFPSAKFIVLTRDVRDNVVSKVNRKLNWRQHPFFLSWLWQLTYDNIGLLKKNKSAILNIRYEDFVTDPEYNLQLICDFIEVKYDPAMLQTEGVYAQFLQTKKEQLPVEFHERLIDFHSGLFKLPSTEKIGHYQNQLSQDEICSVERIAKSGLLQFNYALHCNEISSASINFKMWYYRILAKLYRPFLLTLYYYIPFSAKVFIKRIRKKSIDV
jgi:hypothetical protein